MSNAYVAAEVAKIIDKDKNSSEQLALACSWVLAHYKGVNIRAFDVKETSSLCDYNLVASAENTTQARAMIEEMIVGLKAKDIEAISLEGMGDAEWILLDLGSVIVHVFQEISRDVFDIDSLWMSSPQLTIPSEYYFGSSDAQATKKSSTENYF